MVGGERLDATYLRTVGQLETNLSTRAKTQQRTMGELVEQVSTMDRGRMPAFPPS